MKRTDFLKFLKGNNCVLVREGAKHSLFFNIETRKSSTIPRHSEINDFLCKKICKDLGINS
ncbi:MAG: type II toxin-antitoxin system HicA family toxin [Candidatus Paceibacterota bacterium]